MNEPTANNTTQLYLEETDPGFLFVLAAALSLQSLGRGRTVNVENGTADFARSTLDAMQAATSNLNPEVA